MSSNGSKDTSTEGKPFQPKIAESDLFKFWQDCKRLNFGDTGDYCGGCVSVEPVTFFTGEVVLLFGDLDSAPSKVESFCRVHGFEEIQKGRRPTGGAVYVEAAHRDSDYEELTEEVKGAIIEGLTRLTILMDAIESLGNANPPN